MFQDMTSATFATSLPICPSRGPNSEGRLKYFIPICSLSNIIERQIYSSVGTKAGLEPRSLSEATILPTAPVPWPLKVLVSFGLKLPVTSPVKLIVKWISIEILTFTIQWTVSSNAQFCRKNIHSEIFGSIPFEAAGSITFWLWLRRRW